VKRKKIHHTNGNQRRAGEDIMISYKVHFKTTRDQGHFIMIKLKKQIDNSTVIIDLNITFSLMGKTTKQISKETACMYNII
jgi:hypothetical protein